MLFDAGSPARREHGWETFPRNLLCIPLRQAPEVTWVSPGYFAPCISSLYRLEDAIPSHAPSTDLVPPQLGLYKKMQPPLDFWVPFQPSPLLCVCVSRREERARLLLAASRRESALWCWSRGKGLLWTEARFTRG